MLHVEHEKQLTHQALFRAETTVGQGTKNVQFFLVTFCGNRDFNVCYINMNTVQDTVKTERQLGPMYCCTNLENILGKVWYLSLKVNTGGTRFTASATNAVS